MVDQHLAGTGFPLSCHKSQTHRKIRGQSIMACSPKRSRATAGTFIAAALLTMLPAGSSSASPRVDGLRREGLTTGMPSLAFAGIQLPACARPRRICHRGSVAHMCKTQKRGTVLGMRMSGGGDDEVRAIIEKSKSDAANNVPFSEEELERAVRSLKILLADDPDADKAIDWEAYRKLLAESAHKSHKDWDQTSESARRLADIVKGPGDAVFHKLFERVLVDGNWQGAESAAAERAGKPWAVLVTGVNGIRKTSSVYQAWFREALKKALADQYDGQAGDLPDGASSFFRQLDYMIATVANEDFRALYQVEDISLYASLKDSIFARYRTLAEMLGVLLLRSAQAHNLNVLVETSGRDVAMFKYIDTFFPDETYRKLVVHFSINDLGYAERSVDSRMVKEMSDGKAAAATGSALELIRANAGGPYGSAVLKGVQADSERVWEGVKAGSEGVGATWYKAGIEIEGGEEAWSVKVQGHDDVYLFGPPRQ